MELYKILMLSGGIAFPLFLIFSTLSDILHELKKINKSK